MRKLIGAYLLCAIWTAGALGNACAQSMEAAQLMQATNEDRAQHGLRPLEWDPALARAAKRHAELMVGQRALSHQYYGEAELETRVAQEGAHFHVIAENLAAAATPAALEAEWMQSPGHRANILDPRLNKIGVGLVRQGGYLWAVEDFSASVTVLGSSQIESAIALMLSQRGIAPESDVAAARETCAMDHGAAGGLRPKFIMRWEASDLNRLPDVLEQKISTGRYHTAAVGSCSGESEGPGFTSYHLAVLLF
jgi:Cysteine-rich secretory protein family